MDDVQGEHRLPIKLMQGMLKALPIALGIVAAVTTLIVAIGVSMHGYKKRCSIGRVFSGWRTYLEAINENRSKMSRQTPVLEMTLNDFTIVKSDRSTTPIWYYMIIDQSCHVIIRREIVHPKKRQLQ